MSKKPLKGIEKKLAIHPLYKTEPEKKVDNSDHEQLDDADQAYQNILETAKDIKTDMEKLRLIADNDEETRQYEALIRMASLYIDVNKDIIVINEKKKKVKEAEHKDNNTLFTGTPKDLRKILKEDDVKTDDK